MRHRRLTNVIALVAAISSSFGGGSPMRAVEAADPSAASSDAVLGPEYHLPAPAGATLKVHRGNGPADGRSEDERYAFDFVTADGDERFEVVAARGGTVISARSGVVGGRCDQPLDGPRPTCWREVNYVLIDHGDGTSALYTHLRRGDLPVRIGDVVAAGQPLGVAGSSGWTDHVGLRFQVQETPTWDVHGHGGWFAGTSVPVAFGDADVLEQRASGVPETGDEVESSNAGPVFEPFRFAARPPVLPAAVPFGEDVERALRGAYEADSPDGYGLHFEADAGQPPVPVRPLFGGELVFAGCAMGESASLGRTVVIAREVDGTTYHAVHGHLLSIEPALLETASGLVAEPLPSGSAVADSPRAVAPTDTIGRFGATVAADADPVLACLGDEAEPGGDAGQPDLFVAILRDATVTPEGEIVGGTPVSPEPLVGERGYEGFAWWAGPVSGAAVDAGPGRPRARWNERTPASGSHLPYGQPVTLRAKVRDTSDISQVRFRAWYPRWPQGDQSRELPSFDPAEAWRELAVCSAPGGAGVSGNLCQWEGSPRDARVSYVWDPTAAKPQPSAPWLPRARATTSASQRSCVPVSLAVEVIDRAGHVWTEVGSLPLPATCDDAEAEAVAGAHVLYLDPLVPPVAPTARGDVGERGWPPVYEEDPLRGAIAWRDRSGNEDGFRIYARRHWFRPDCSVAVGDWRQVTTVAANRERYRPRHQQVQAALPVPEEASEAPGSMAYWEYGVSAYNAAGETSPVLVGGFLGGSEAFCDLGLEPPPGEGD